MREAITIEVSPSAKGRWNYRVTDLRPDSEQQETPLLRDEWGRANYLTGTGYRTFEKAARAAAQEYARAVEGTTFVALVKYHAAYNTVGVAVSA